VEVHTFVWSVLLQGRGVQAEFYECTPRKVLEIARDGGVEDVSQKSKECSTQN
jgi:hypothetical protein